MKTLRERQQIKISRVYSTLLLGFLGWHSLANAMVQDFGQVAVNGSTESTTISYSFSGVTTAPTFSLAWNRDFQIAPPSCILGSATICKIVVTFNPAKPGLREDELSVIGQSGQLLAQTLLRGVATSPLIALYPGVISTTAGNGTWGYEDSGNPYFAEFRNPQSVALDGSANALYVADSINAVVRKITLSSGAVSTVVGNGNAGFGGDGGPAIQALLNTPTGLAVDGGGNLYIADEGNNRIRRVDALTHIITTVAGGGTSPSGTDGNGDGGPATSALLSGPQSLAVDGSGDIYIADTYNQIIRVVNAATGLIKTVAGGGSSPGVDGYGDGAVATSAALNNPCAIAIDSKNNLYIADTGNNLIRRVDVSTQIISAIAGNGTQGYSGDKGLATSARLAWPEGVALDAGNNVYIADYGNNAIREVSASTQNIITVAGGGSAGYDGDGDNPTLAALAGPIGIAVDEDGNLYIADYANNVVRQISFAVQQFDFTNEPVGALSVPAIVSAVNIGNQTLTLGAISVSTNFQQVSTGLSDCASGIALNSGERCDIGLSFAPTQIGVNSGYVKLTSNSLNNAEAVQTISLSGTGASGAGPSVSLSTSALTFNPQTVGTPSASQIVTLTNGGGSPFTISSIWLSGPQENDFQISTTCGASLAAAASCSVSVTFTPAGNGTRTALLYFADSVVGTPQSVALNGTGNGGAAFLSTSTLTFSTAISSTSPAQTVTLSNTGSSSLQMLGVTVTGTNASEFQVSSNCGASILAGGSCNFFVTFSPAATGAHTATLSIFDGANGSPQTVALSGTAATVIASSGLRFIPVTPCRVADTRYPNGPFGGPILSAGTSRDFAIPSSGCHIPATAQAYSLNFTVVPAGSLSFLTVWPAGEPQPWVSLLNSDGRIKANAAIVPAGTNGAVSVYGTDNTHVVIDINGYFVPATNTAALGFYPLTPCRIADTRSTTPLAAGVTRDFSPMSSACGVPPSAAAYSLNYTAIPIVPISYLSTWPAGQPQPVVSTLNTTLEVTANAAIVPAGTNGNVTVYSSDPTDLVIDINGYFAPATQSGTLSLFNVTPCRVLDTRFAGGPISSSRIVSVSGSTCAVSTTARAYVLNATVVPAAPLSYLSLWPDGTPWPVSSILNAADQVIASNMAIIPTNNGSIDTLASNPTDLVLDISAYFAP